jgi:hypothetical protein
MTRQMATQRHSSVFATCTLTRSKPSSLLAPLIAQNQSSNTARSNARGDDPVASLVRWRRTPRCESAATNAESRHFAIVRGSEQQEPRRRERMRRAARREPTRVRRTRIPVLVTAVVFGFAAVWTLTPSGRESSRAQTSAQSAIRKSQPSLPGVAGQRIYIDPATGKFTERPVDARAAQEDAQDNALSTSHEGLVERPLPGGGSVIDLQGRFQSPLIATLDANGKLTIDHPKAAQPPVAKKPVQ